MPPRGGSGAAGLGATAEYACVAGFLPWLGPLIKVVGLLGFILLAMFLGFSFMCGHYIGAQPYGWLYSLQYWAETGTWLAAIMGVGQQVLPGGVPRIPLADAMPGLPEGPRLPRAPPHHGRWAPLVFTALPALVGMWRRFRADDYVF